MFKPKKQQLESRFRTWMTEDPERAKEYEGTLDMISTYYDETDASVRGKVYALEAGLIGCDISLFAFRFYRMAAGLFSEDPEEVAGTQAAMTNYINGHFREYDQATDRDLFVNLMTKFRNDIDPCLSPVFLRNGSGQVQG
jgi:hypothetical protein